VLVAGSAVSKNRELLDGRWDKHDVKDAANVADLLSQCRLPQLIDFDFLIILERLINYHIILIAGRAV